MFFFIMCSHAKMGPCTVFRGPLNCLSFISSYITGISTYIIQSVHIYPSPTQGYLASVDAVEKGRQVERNKARVGRYTDTLMQGSLAVETNPCFIMFTCGWTLWSSALHSHCQSRRLSHDPVYLCVRVLQILCVFDVAAVYLCGCVAIWAHRLFVLDRTDTGGEGPPALLLFLWLSTSCLGLDPYSFYLSDLDILCFSLSGSFRNLGIKWLFVFQCDWSCVSFSCRILSERQTQKALGFWWPSRQTGRKAARSLGRQQRCTCQQESISKP